MEEGRIPAQDCLLVSTPTISCGIIAHNERNNTAQCAERQPIISIKPGNKCGHSRKNPNFWQPKVSNQARSSVIYTIMNKTEEAYFDPRHSLKFAQHRNDTQIRSELRQVIIDALRMMVYYMDDESQRVGRRLENNKWDDLSLEKISKRLDVSYDRVKDAMKQIIDCGYLFVKRQSRKDRFGKIFALPSMRQLTPKFFTDLGMKYEKIFNLKKYKEEIRLKKEMKVDKKASRVAQNFIKTCFDTAKKSLSTAHRISPTVNNYKKEFSPPVAEPKTASEWLKNITASLKPSPS